MTTKNKKKKNQERQEKVEEAFNLIEEGIEKITSTDSYIDFLKFASKFTQYSFRNQMLIWMQMPSAKLVAGYNTWKNKHNRQVKKGAKGIRILRPSGSYTIEKENEDGETEEKTIKTFSPTYVFDISQTEGEPVSSLSDHIQTIEGETDLYEKVKSICTFPVEERLDTEGADGFFHLKDEFIAIKRANPTNHKLLTLVHEWGHGLLHSLDKEKERGKLSRKERELEAESVGFIVCHLLGIDTSANSFGYLATFGRNSAIDYINKSKEHIEGAVKAIYERFENEFMPNEELEEISA